MILRRFFHLTIVLVATVFSFQSCFEKEQNQQSDKTPELGKSSIREVIAAMTPEEKIGVIVGDGKFIIARAKADKNKEVPIANRNSKPVIPRLGIKTTALTDGPSGINKPPAPEGAKDYTYTTAFPTPNCVAASWNLELAEEIGKAYGNELLEYDYDLALMPGMNLHRDPRCGRNFEYYSEDPLLTGKMAAAVVNGLQSYGVGATLKHFVANNQETNRRNYNAVISRRALRELYLRGFEIAVKESNPWAIMTSYNRMNGFYTAENPELMRELVRDEWNYTGLFMTDFDGYGDAVAKVRAGSNMLMGGNMQEFNELKEGLKNKTIDESMLDECLVYNLEMKLKSPGMKGYKPSFKPDLDAHAQLAREAAAEGIVLLKNEDNALPLKNEKKIALFGKIGYHLIPFGTGSGGVRSYYHRVSVNDGLNAAGFEVPEAMQQEYRDYIQKIIRENLVPPYFDNPKMRKDNGIKGNQAPPHFRNRLVAFSREKVMTRQAIKKYEAQTDVAVITLGRSAGENYENGYLPITERELDLVRNVSEIFHAAGKKVIVVLNVASVWGTVNWRDYADAILLAWLPGQEGGHAVADILKGAVNPSGKLPDSFPMRIEDVPSYKSFPGIPPENPYNSFYEDGIYVGYRYYNTFDVPTAYEFGYGLSYTTFEYADLKLSATKFTDKIEVTVTVKNTGNVAGKEVVQLYLAAPATNIHKPVHELKGFAKTKLLQPGESEQLAFEIDKHALASFWSGKSAWIADKGDYEVQIGASSKDIRLKAIFNLPEDIVVEKVNDILYPNFNLKELTGK